MAVRLKQERQDLKLRCANWSSDDMSLINFHCSCLLSTFTALFSFGLENPDHKGNEYLIAAIAVRISSLELVPTPVTHK